MVVVRRAAALVGFAGLGFIVGGAVTLGAVLLLTALALDLGKEGE